MKKSEKRNIRKLPFQGKEREFSEISVPLELPKYRIANRRLRADQIDYQLTNKLPILFKIILNLYNLIVY